MYFFWILGISLIAFQVYGGPLRGDQPPEQEDTTDDYELLRNDMDDMIAECTKELGLPEAENDIEKAFHVMSQDPKKKCLASCVFKKSGVIRNEKIIIGSNDDDRLKSCYFSVPDSADVCTRAQKVAGCTLMYQLQRNGENLSEFPFEYLHMDGKEFLKYFV